MPIVTWYLSALGWIVVVSLAPWVAWRWFSEYRERRASWYRRNLPTHGSDFTGHEWFVSAGSILMAEKDGRMDDGSLAFRLTPAKKVMPKEQL